MIAAALFALTIAAAPPGNAKPLDDNEQIAAWDVSWDDAKLTFTAEVDTVIVWLAAGKIEVVGANGTAQQVNQAVGDVEYLKKGTTRTQRVITKGGLRAIVVQQKAASPAPLPLPNGTPDSFDRPGMKKLVQGEHLTAFHYAWSADQKVAQHLHTHDTVVIFLDDGALKSIGADGKTNEIAAVFGQERFSKRGTIHAEELAKGKVSAVLIELQ